MTIAAYSFRQKICIVVSLLVAGLLGHIIPPFGGLTPVGLKVLFAFAGTLIGWIGVNLAYGSFLGLITMSLAGYSPNSSAYIMSFFGSKMLASMAGVLIFVAALRHHKLERFLIAKLFSIRVAQGHPYALFATSIFTIYIVTILTGGTTASALVMLPILTGIFSQAGFSKGSPQVSVFCMGMLVAIGCAVVSFPFIGIAIVMVSAMESSGLSISPISYVCYSLPMSIVIITSYILYVRFFLRVDMSKLKSICVDIEAGTLDSLSKSLLILFCVAMVGMLICSTSLPIVSTLGSMGILYLCIFIGILFKINGKSIVDFKELAPHFEWQMFFFLGAVGTIPAALNSDAAGLKTAIFTIVEPMASTFEGPFFLIFIILATAVITECINNSVAGAMMVSICCALSTAIPGINVVLCASMIMFACEMGYLAPMASGTAALIYSTTEWVNPLKLPAHGLGIYVLEIIVLLTVGVFWSRIVF